MKMRLLVICLCFTSILAVALSTTQANAQVQGSAPPPKTLSGYIPSVVSDGEAHLIGHHSGSDPLTLLINLQIRDESALEQFIHAVSDPTNPHYRQYMTLAQENQAFNPTSQQIQTVLSWLHAHSLPGNVSCPNNLLIDTSGTFAQFEQLFHITLNDYSISLQGKQILFYAPANEPSIPTTLSNIVYGIVGLDNFPQSHTDMGVAHPENNGNANGVPPYYPQDFANAYDVNPLWNQSDNGSNQHIGITIWGTPPSQNARSKFDKMTRAAPVNLQVIPVLKGHKGYFFNTLGGPEAGIDVEYTAGLAPGATIDYYQVPTDRKGNPLNPGLEQALCIAGSDTNNNQQISNSWVECEQSDAYTNAVEQILEANTATGHDYLFASGDWGSSCVFNKQYICSGGIEDPYPIFPASSPYVTSVGGTRFSANINGSYPGETAWQYSPLNCNSNPQQPPYGSGGGYSTLFSQPSWQAGIINSNWRGYPDISAEADPATGAFICYDVQGGTQCTIPDGIIGNGTSLATPIWAGMLADANEYLQSENLPPIGFINPTLYSIATHQQQYAPYHDIPAYPGPPANQYDYTNGQYNTANGWDPVTGWGSPDFYNLAQDLGVYLWNIVPSPNPGSFGDGLSGVAAVSVNDVWAVGSYSNSNGPTQTLIEQWNGANWNVIPSPNPGIDAGLSGVAAVSANDVWAVGSYSNSSGPTQTLIEQWNGTRWKIVPSPNGPAQNSLSGVAAVSANDVWAVGSFRNSKDKVQTLIEQWDGTRWKIVPNPNPGSFGNGLTGVTALSANDVWAVGDYANSNGTPVDTLIEQWDGSNWNVVSSPSPGTGNYLYGVAGVSTNDVWAIGYQGNSNGQQTLVEQWDGTSWNVVPSPNPGVNGNLLFGVTALSANDVWTVGYDLDSNDYLNTLIEQWNGTTWNVVPSPNGPKQNSLTAVAALSANDAWAVGSYNNSNGTQQTLIEQWN